MAAPVVHWEVYAKDGPRLHGFYAEVFGWKINSDNPMKYGLVNTGTKTGIAGGIAQEDPTVPMPKVTFYIQVDELQPCLDKVANLGGRTLLPPTEIPGMVTFAMFADPEGNAIGLVKGPAAKPRKKARRRSVKKAAKKAPVRKRTKPGRGR